MVTSTKWVRKAPANVLMSLGEDWLEKDAMMVGTQLAGILVFDTITLQWSPGEYKGKFKERYFSDI